MKKITLTINGMSCQHCVMRVTKALKELAGIQNLEVGIGSATITFNESEVTKEEIEKAITGAGYTIAG